MAAERLIVPEWRDDQSYSRYPFTDASTLTSNDGAVLDNGIFLDASLYPIGAGPALYLTSITLNAGLTTLYLGDDAVEQRCSASFDPLNPPDNLAVSDSQGRPAGILVSSSSLLLQFQGWAYGTHTFDHTAEFVSSVFLPLPESGVEAFTLADGSLFHGDIWIVGEDGVVVRKGDGNTIRVDVVGDPLFLRRLCTPTNLFATPRFLQTINGLKPDAYGNFTLTVNTELASDTVLRIYPDASRQGVVIELVGQPTGANS